MRTRSAATRPTSSMSARSPSSICSSATPSRSRITTGGPYTLHLSLADNRLVFTVGDEKRAPIVHVMLSLSPFRRLVKDYFLMCESYYQAVKTAPPSRIEAIDMGRRGLHDEGSRLLMERLKGKVLIDIATARRLFTLHLRAALEGLMPCRGETPTCRARSSSPAAATPCARRWPPRSSATSPAGASM